MRRHYKNGKLVEDFNRIYLNDAVWQATRFSIEANIINPFNEQSVFMRDYIEYYFQVFYLKLDVHS